MIEEVREVAYDEWKKVDRKPSLSNRFEKMYTFKEEEVQAWEEPPLVDTVVIRLARHVTLPMNDAVFFKDVSERKIDI